MTSVETARMARGQTIAERVRAMPLGERLEFGNLTIAEVCALRHRSHAGFYADLKRGLVSIRKVAGRSVVYGPVAAAYIRGEPLPEEPANGEAA